MGWSFVCDRKFGRKQMIEEIKGPGFFSEAYKPLEHRVVGNNVWTLLQSPEQGKIIALTLMKGGGRDSGWGYKGLDETWGPTEVNCPLSLLAKAGPPPNGNAAEWRIRVREYHANARAIRSRVYKAGMQLDFGGNRYELKYPLEPKRGWVATMTSTGRVYRFSPRTLNKSTIVEASHA